MKNKTDINGIPAVMWGKPDNKLIIAVHGDMSNKEDTVIELLAETAVAKGYGVLSFDLPGHGERSRESNYILNPLNSITDLQAVYAFVQTQTLEISLFACSIGAYFSLLAFGNHEIQKSFFLSPVINMERVIGNMMAAFKVTEERLKAERQIPLPIGKILDWEYYTYVREHPVCWLGETPVAILYGSQDNISDRSDVERFTRKYGAQLTVMEGSEHFFHTEEQLRYYKQWLSDNL